MNDPADVIKASIGVAPADLVSFYQTGSLLRYPESRIHFLALSEAAAFSTMMARTSLVQRLCLWFLDDANDSNPFAYIARGPCAGMILHFSHDLPAMAFSSLGSCLQKMRAAGETAVDIDDVARDSIHVDLDDELFELAKENSDDAQYLIGRYLPVCDRLSLKTVELLACHADFFVREDLANYLIANPEARYLSAAVRLEQDKHPQVRRPGKRAVYEIQRRMTG